VPTVPGVPEATAEPDVWSPASNDLDEIETRFRAEGEAIAAVIVEPVVGNMGLVPPQPGYLEGLRPHHGRARRAADLRRGLMTGSASPGAGAEHDRHAA